MSAKCGEVVISTSESSFSREDALLRNNNWRYKVHYLPPPSVALFALAKWYATSRCRLGYN